MSALCIRAKQTRSKCPCCDTIITVVFRLGKHQWLLCCKFCGYSGPAVITYV